MTAKLRGRGIFRFRTGTQGGARTARWPWAKVLRPFGAENPVWVPVLRYLLCPAKKMSDTISSLWERESGVKVFVTIFANHR